MAPIFGLAILVTNCIVWWYAVRGIVGDRLGPFHWVPVGVACFGVPIMIADLKFRPPQFSAGLIVGWSVFGLMIALVSLFRGRTRRST